MASALEKRLNIKKMNSDFFGKSKDIFWLGKNKFIIQNSIVRNCNFINCHLDKGYTMEIFKKNSLYYTIIKLIS